MGFFESLLSGFHDVGSWLHDNSGTIETVVNTIAKVAGAALLGSEHDGRTSDQSPLQMPEFVDLIGQASSVLEQESEKQTLALKSATPGLDPSSASVTNNIQTFPGLWAQPANLDSEGRPPHSMTRDVSQMLTMCGFPQVIPYGPNNEPLDVADSIAKLIFANIPPNPLSVAVGTDPFTTVSFEFSTNKGDMSIKGAHSYYQIPLGSSANNNAWYGVVHMNATMDRKASDALRTQTLAASKVTPRVITTGALPKTTVPVVIYDVWAVTLRITWASGVDATRMGPRVANGVMDSPVVQRLESNDVTGAIQRLKVWARVNIVPAGIKEAVQTIVNMALTEANVPALVTVEVVGGTIVALQQ